MEKVCSICKENKSEDQFNFKNKEKGTKHSCCKSCQKEKDARLYENSPIRSEKIREAARKQILVAKEFIKGLKEKGECARCGDRRWYVLDYHHVGPKVKAVSAMVKQGASLETIKNEIEKCELLCANCHREEHFINGAVAEMD